MNVMTARGQWMKEDRRFALNPLGRIQTKKHRPVVPVVGLLHSALLTTNEWLVCSQKRRLAADGTAIAVQTKVDSIKSGWASAREALGIPVGWGPKLVRHSMATILANRRVDLIELEIALGHRVLRKTTSRYAIFNPDYLSTVAAGIEDVVADLAQRYAALRHPNYTREIIDPHRIEHIQNPANPLD